VHINYQSGGSGAGILQLTEGTVDFGASDAPMTSEQIAKITKANILHFPTVLRAVVPTYHIDGVGDTLKFTGDTLAGIFVGTIKKWNDASLKKDNPGVNFPDKEITVVHRSDSSGTSFVWTDYLSKVNPRWKSKVGNGAAVSWPTGLGGKGNEGVAGLIKENPNSIGYVELIYAVQSKMSYGLVRNSSGTFVKADFNTVTEAAPWIVYFADNHRHMDSLYADDAIAIHALDVHFLAGIVGLDDDGRRLIDFFDCERDRDAFVIGAGVDDDLARVFHTCSRQDIWIGGFAANEVDRIGKRILVCGL
jgi:phosphate ABC transporter phosphate-binding protein